MLTLPPGPVLAGLCVMAFLAGTARGFSGFGAALIFVPLASSLIGPKATSAVLLVVDYCFTAPMVPGAWRRADRRDVLTMLVGAVAGVPLGAFILAHSDAVSVRWMICCLIFCLLILLVSGWRYSGPPKLPLTVGVGVVAGTFSGIAQVGGPPVVAYWLGGNNDAQRVRANIVLYFAGSSLMVTVSYIVSGVLGFEIVGLALAVGPAYGAGIFLGTRLFGRASELVFRRLCYVLIAVSGLIGLPLWDGLR